MPRSARSIAAPRSFPRSACSAARRVRRRGPRRLAAALEVLGQGHRDPPRPPARATRPRAGGRAGGRASVSMPYAASRTSACRKRYSAASGAPSARPPDDELAHLELGEQRRRPRPRRAARRPAPPERLAEDARGPQRPPRAHVERLEPRLHHRQHRLRQVLALARRRRADLLLEVEGVAVRPLDQRRHERRARALAEHLAHEPLARPAREPGEAELVPDAARPTASGRARAPRAGRAPAP